MTRMQPSPLPKINRVLYPKFAWAFTGSLAGRGAVLRPVPGGRAKTVRPGRE